MKEEWVGGEEEEEMELRVEAGYVVNSMDANILRSVLTERGPNQAGHPHGIVEYVNTTPLHL